MEAVGHIFVVAHQREAIKDLVWNTLGASRHTILSEISYTQKYLTLGNILHLKISNSTYLTLNNVLLDIFHNNKYCTKNILLIPTYLVLNKYPIFCYLKNQLGLIIDLGRIGDFPR